jgi:hypothetical protein
MFHFTFHRENPSFNTFFLQTISISNREKEKQIKTLKEKEKKKMIVKWKEPETVTDLIRFQAVFLSYCSVYEEIIQERSFCFLILLRILTSQSYFFYKIYKNGNQKQCSKIFIVETGISQWIEIGSRICF